MSTLKVSAIAHPDATSTAFTLHSNGTVTLGPSVSLGGFDSGTAMMFVQTAAPTGWTKSTTHDNKALRVVSGAASSGGSTAFTSVFASRTPSGSVSGSNSGGSVSNTTLSTTQMPSHSHLSGVGRVGTLSLIRSQANSVPVTQIAVASGNVTFEALSSNTGGGAAHNHGFTNPSWSGSFTGSAMDFAVQYVDVIIATKD